MPTTLPTGLPENVTADAQAAAADLANVTTGKALVDDLNAKLAAATANETALISKSATSMRTLLDTYDAWAASTRQQVQDFVAGVPTAAEIAAQQAADAAAKAAADAANHPVAPVVPPTEPTIDPNAPATPAT